MRTLVKTKKISRKVLMSVIEKAKNGIVLKSKSQKFCIFGAAVFGHSLLHLQMGLQSAYPFLFL